MQFFKIKKTKYPTNQSVHPKLKQLELKQMEQNLSDEEKKEDDEWEKREIERHKLAGGYPILCKNPGICCSISFRVKERRKLKQQLRDEFTKQINMLEDAFQQFRDLAHLYSRSQKEQLWNASPNCQILHEVKEVLEQMEQICEKTYKAWSQDLDLDIALKQRLNKRVIKQNLASDTVWLSYNVMTWQKSRESFETKWANVDPNQKIHQWLKNMWPCSVLQSGQLDLQRIREWQMLEPISFWLAKRLIDDHRVWIQTP